MIAAPRLIFTKEGETLKSTSLEKEVSIGRGEGNVIRLEDRAVSRNHAIVRQTKEGVHIEKQSDFAPIRLNGVECTRALLKEGDVVDIGPYRMRLDAPKVAPAPPVPVAVSDSHFQVPDATPPESAVGAFDLGELTKPISAADFGGPVDVAQPIAADSSGAEAGVLEADTNIFPSGGSPDVAPLELALGAATEEVVSMPDEVEAPVAGENSATNLLPSDVIARLEIAPGLANVQSFPLSKDEIFIGRGRECDIVLNDKKSSRKNTVITREGNHYRVKDLDSSNGTYLNNTSVKDVELSADDMLRVGEVEIRFIADSVAYEKRKANFVSVPAPASVEPSYLGADSLSPFSAPVAGTPVGYGEPFGIPDAAPMAAPAPTRKGIFAIYDKYVRNFKTLKPLQKLLVVLSVVLFVSWYLEEDPVPVEKPTVRTGPKKGADGKPVLATDYDGLPAAQRGQIDEAVRKATDFLRLQDFDKAIYEVQQRVYPILADYPQAKEIERYAQEGKRRKDAIEEEAKRKEEALKLKTRIEELESATRNFMAKRQYEQAKETFGEILSVDPENVLVAEWKKEIDTWVEEQDRILKEKQVQEEINKRAWDTYQEGFELHKAGKYREAIEIYKRVPELGASDSRLIKKAATMVKTCLDSIRELREPHIVRAKELEKGGDLAGAFKEYEIASKVDPSHSEGWAGMERIRDVLTDRAKVIYTEAVIAESYSDFKIAQAKYNEILKMAPEGSLYYQRAQRKLQSYTNFHMEETP